ncbi:MAG: hypothetical protein HY035_07780 [Nitrospirae bacterium]|nr:hypothetical protein [Nitrospirota bacterium]
MRKVLRILLGACLIVPMLTLLSFSESPSNKSTVLIKFLKKVDATIKKVDATIRDN